LLPIPTIWWIPTSQYRNKMIFSVVANHHELFGVDASWTYFEAHAMELVGR
jgi:hypothetical protein